jgi:thiol-disulfide isomerase/thioredoxin
MSKNIKLTSIVLIVLFSFFVLLKGLDKSNTYSPELSTTKIDFNFKAKDLFSDEEIFLDDLIKNDGMSLINIWASWCLPCRDEHAYLLNLKLLKAKRASSYSGNDWPIALTCLLEFSIELSLSYICLSFSPR